MVNTTLAHLFDEAIPDHARADKTLLGLTPVPTTSTTTHPLTPHRAPEEEALQAFDDDVSDEEYLQAAVKTQRQGANFKLDPMAPFTLEVTGVLHPRLYQALCIDLVYNTLESHEAICGSYGTTLDHVRDLMARHPPFMKIMEDVKKDASERGMAGGTAARAGALVDLHLATIHKMMLNPVTSDVDKIRGVKLLIELANPSKSSHGRGSSEVNPVVPGTAISFNITLQPTPGQPAPRVINGDPTLPDV